MSTPPSKVLQQTFGDVDLNAKAIRAACVSRRRSAKWKARECWKQARAPKVFVSHKWRGAQSGRRGERPGKSGARSGWKMQKRDEGIDVAF